MKNNLIRAKSHKKLLFTLNNEQKSPKIRKNEKSSSFWEVEKEEKCESDKEAKVREISHCHGNKNE
jgi:hypothetical protein